MCNNKKIYALLSITNDYDQPDNNLVAWWWSKPNTETLLEAIGVNNNSDTLKMVQDLLNRNVVRYADTDYRLRLIDEGIVPDSV